MRGNIGERVGAPARRPGPCLTRAVSPDIGGWRSCAGGGEVDAKLRTSRLGLRQEPALTLACPAVDRLLFGGQSLAEVDETLHVDFRNLDLRGDLDERGQFIQILAHRRKPERGTRS